MQKNGRESCTVNSIHINIGQFFVKVIEDKEEIELQFCPTHLMIANYFTKPLQGNLLKLFCYLIMVYKHNGDFLKDIESTAEERVGNQNKVTENSNLKNNHEHTI